jgi:hypothetical protein
LFIFCFKVFALGFGVVSALFKSRFLVFEHFALAFSFCKLLDDIHLVEFLRFYHHQLLVLGAYYLLESIELPTKLGLLVFTRL